MREDDATLSWGVGLGLVFATPQTDASCGGHQSLHPASDGQQVARTPASQSDDPCGRQELAVDLQLSQELQRASESQERARVGAEIARPLADDAELVRAIGV